MNELNYDVKKLPLGKLSKNTILRGFQALKDLAALMDDPASAQTHYGTAYGPASKSDIHPLDPLPGYLVRASSGTSCVPPGSPEPMRITVPEYLVILPL